jgi:putative DNA primase/helicase
MTPTARVVFSANRLPSFTDSTYGLSRRLVLIPFMEQVSPDRIDAQLGQKLLSELPGIFKWAVDGLRSLRRRGAFLQPAASQRLLDRSRRHADPIVYFLRETYQRDASAMVTVQELRRDYNAYAERCMLPTIKDSVMGMKLLEAFPDATPTRPKRNNPKRRRFYAGIRRRSKESESA